MTSDLTNSSDIIRNTAEQSNFLTDTIAQLRVCDRESQLLETTVDDIRQATKCDRAVIYSLQAADRGKSPPLKTWYSHRNSQDRQLPNFLSVSVIVG